MHGYQSCAHCQKLFTEDALSRENNKLICDDCRQEMEFYQGVDAAEQDWYLENSDAAGAPGASGHN